MNTWDKVKEAGGEMSIEDATKVMAELTDMATSIFSEVTRAMAIMAEWYEKLPADIKEQIAKHSVDKEIGKPE